MSHRLTSRTLAGLLLSGILMGGGFGQAGAGEALTHPQWLPWLGCWTPVGEGTESSMLCIRPLDGNPGVEMVTIVDGEVVGTETVYADGERRAVEAEGCRGWEEGAFADDGRRVFFRSDLMCEGDVDRRSTGLFAWMAPDEWIDVKGVSVAGEPSVGALRYREADPEKMAAAGVTDPAEGMEMAVMAARIAGSAEPTTDDVVEALDQLDVEVLQAWIVEGTAGFDLNGDELLRLADAGVPSDVIDVMVAVTYPERFAFDTRRGVESQAPVRPAGRTVYAYPRRYFGPFYGSSAYYYSSFYSPYGYWGFPGYYGGGYGYYYPSPIVVRPAPSEPPGRAVRGQGYTRGSGSATPGRAARPRTRGDVPAASRAPSGSRVTAPSSQGSPRGGASPRGQAKPRRPGG